MDRLTKWQRYRHRLTGKWDHMKELLPKTRPDTRRSVAHGWAGAVMLKNRYRKKTGYGPTDRRTKGHTLIEMRGRI